MVNKHKIMIPIFLLVSSLLITGCNDKSPKPEGPLEHLIITFNKDVDKDDVLNFNKKYNLVLIEGTDINKVDFKSGAFLVYKFEKGMNISELSRDPIVFQIKNQTLFFQ